MAIREMTPGLRLRAGGDTSTATTASEAMIPSSLPAFTKGTPEQHFSINVNPPLEDVNMAYRDFVLYKGWTRVAILYSGKIFGVRSVPGSRPPIN